jgi:hypothetical protein
MLSLVRQRHIFSQDYFSFERLCGLVVRVRGYRSKGPGSIRSAEK